MPPFLRTAYNYDMNAAGDEDAIKDFGESLTQQSFQEECDINTILKRFGVTGELPTGVRMPEFADFDDVFDFQSAMNAVVSAERSFSAMPAHVRERFGNDPSRFVAFCSDRENLDEARKLGLVPAAEIVPEVKPILVRIDGQDRVATPLGKSRETAPEAPLQSRTDS